MFKSIFYFSVFLSSLSSFASEMIVWNVGQGQWITEVHQDHCLHFDIGGEKNPSRRVWKLCQEKMNIIHLSHWDMDHISFVKSFSSRLKKVCLIEPAVPSPSIGKLKMIEKIPKCGSNESPTLASESKILFHPFRNLKSNESSEVVYSRTFATVIPGDSPKKQEKIWSEEVSSQTKGLILGHHGSRTSTSRELLQHLPNLKWAIASARRSRYGHPHKEVVQALKKEKVPLLKTEDWGHLHFQKSDD